jgi:phosphatidylglycerophosphate synthase
VDRPEYLRRWSALHDGIDPGTVAFVGGWLRLMYAAGRPLAAARVPPSALTLVGAICAWGAVPVVSLGSGWPLLAAVLVVLSAFADGLDGAVAVLSERVSTGGAVLDTVSDRLSDAAYGVGLWVLGAPAWLATSWVGLSFGLELIRWRARRGAPGRLDVVTVGERPTRIIVTALTLVAGGLVASHAETVALFGVVAGVITSAVGVIQLAVDARLRPS